MLSPKLEQTLHRALAHANERRHEYATLEHLLLALTEDEDAVAALRKRKVDLDRLRRDLMEYFDSEFSNLVVSTTGDAKPTAGFQRVLQRAAIHVQRCGRNEVTGSDLLPALLPESQSHAVFYLQEQRMSRGGAVGFVSHDAVWRFTS